ncbi:prepilin peptidase [Novosphingopyxis sp.]|uniref:prepilin peptidase n=1 Tax=Novosphingopyxis sp. TaxID=2709690 RepID=UPI003B59AF1C
MPTWFWPIVFGLLGAILGSFIATLCLRWPAGRSVTAGRSHCDACGRALSAPDLVPLLSALASGGRCRSCRTPIDPAHGSIEFAALLAGAAPFLLLAPVPAAAWALMAWLLIPLIWLDNRHLWLPDPLVLPLALAGLLAGGYLGGLTPVDRLIGGAAGWAVLASIAGGYRRLRGFDGLGQGDPKLLGAAGLWLGWQALPFLLLLASGVGLALALARSRTIPLAQQRIPFGTAIGLAALLIGLLPPLA